MAQPPSAQLTPGKGNGSLGRLDPWKGKGLPLLSFLKPGAGSRASWRKGTVRESAAWKNKRGVSEALRTPGEASAVGTTVRIVRCGRKVYRPGI